jgi:hypothetical protein
MSDEIKTMSREDAKRTAARDAATKSMDTV